MATPEIEALTRPLDIGEGPHWDHNDKVLYFIEVPGAIVHKYNPATKRHTCTTKIEGGYVTFVLPVRGKKDQFAISIGRDLAIMTWDGENGPPSKIERLLTIEKEPEKSANRFNDGKADPNGLLWTGTMGPELSPGVFARDGAAFYSISSNLDVKTHITKVGMSNGMAWSKDMKYFYYNDSLITKVFRFKFNAATREITDRESIFDFEENNVGGLPDGMAIDEEDKLWVGCFSPGEVIRIDPDSGKLLQRLVLPAPIVTSCAFGGPNLDELYVTTGSIRMTPEQKQKYPSAGALFKVTGLGVKGLPGTPVNF